MAITVTWDDGVSAPTAFAVPDDVMASLDQYRAMVTVFTGTEFVAKYATVKDMIVGVFVETVVLPALAQFPTTSIQEALANVASAKAALAQAQASALPGFVGA